MKDHQECLFLKGSVSEAIRELVRGGNESYRRLARRTGIDAASIVRFASGLEIRSSTLDKLADHYGVGVAIRPKKEKPKNVDGPQADSIRVSQEHSVEVGPSTNGDEAAAVQQLATIGGSATASREAFGRGSNASSLRKDAVDLDEGRDRPSGESRVSG